MIYKQPIDNQNNFNNLKMNKMKKYFMNLMLAVVASTLLFNSCDEKEVKEPIDILIEEGVLRGNLTHEVTLDASKTYALAGAFIVEKGGSITIPAGTKIVAEEGFGNYILVAQGGKIFIEGTAEKPVKMVGKTTKPVEGFWGGLIINGYAPLTSSQQEAKTEINNDYSYGGNKTNDNSGSITYLILESTGARSSADIEHNGLTLNGVGNGTKIENVFVYECADDGIEFFGGSVNVTNLLVVNTDDDMFDFTQAYRKPRKQRKQHKQHKHTSKIITSYKNYYRNETSHFPLKSPFFPVDAFQPESRSAASKRTYQSQKHYSASIQAF
jgi:hypothetical protein